VQRSAKGDERGHHLGRVDRTRLDPDVEVLGSARAAMDTDGIGPDDEKTDLSGQ
jgi:hypothetical protein